MDGISEFRPCRRLTDMGEQLLVELYLGERNYKRHNAGPAGQITS